MRYLFAVVLTLTISFYGYSQTIEKPRPKIGLVLSGGGAKGLAHIGALKVLEEVGIPIDYIGGTSMGSIIGGLYAIGYNSEELNNFAVYINWDNLLNDQINRKNLSFEEKEENARYIVSFPIKEKKIGLPSGAITGQNIYALLNKMASPVYRERDFSKFPIPFLCVATDIENAEATVIKSGYLPQAMRASMAIPSLFTPETINGNIYVDGGVLNNFPVLEVKKMGADIIIGVDVGFKSQPLKTLNSIPGILSQSMYTFTKSEMDKNRQACDILIEPVLEPYTLMSYNNADSIIARGERATRAVLPQLRALLDSLNQYQPEPIKKNTIERFASIQVIEIEITGLNVVPKEFVLRKLQIEVPSELTLTDLDNKIALVYGTQFFNKITYRLEPLGDGAKIILEVVERNTNYFKVGIHYDSNFKTALLLNGTFRNAIVPGSKLTLDLALGENIAFNGLLYLNTGWSPNKIDKKSSRFFPDFGIRATSHKMEVFEYENERQAASYDFFDFTLDFYMQYNLSNKTALGGGVLGDFASISNRVGSATMPASNYLYTNFHIFYKFDSYDRDFYPNSGIQLLYNMRYIKSLSDDINPEAGFFQGNIRYSHAIPLFKRVVLSNSLFGGYSSRDIVPAHYSYYLGGMGGTYLRGMVPFVGLKYMQLSGSNAWSVGTDIRYEAWENNYFTLKTNISKTTIAAKDLLKAEDITFGGGISYGYKSVIGPIELTVMASNNVSGLTGFINIGYWF
jgi:NTE family protein